MFRKLGKMFNSKKAGGARPTLTHTAPEAYSRNGAGGGYAQSGGGRELSEEAIYGRRSSDPVGIKASRSQSDGTILKNPYGRR